MSIPHRRGQTLAELLVAVLLLTVGLLAVAAIAVGIARLTGDTGRRTRGALAIESAIEGARAVRCAPPGAVRTVAESATLPTRTGTRTELVLATVPCP